MSEWKQPEFLNLIFSFRILYSDALLFGGISGSLRKLEI